MLSENIDDKTCEKNRDNFTVVNYIPYPVIVLDKDNNIKFINEKANYIFAGIDLNEKVENIINGFRKEFLKEENNNKQEEIKASIVTEKGQRYFEIFLNNVYDAEGEISEKMITFNDFTEYKLKEDDLEKEIEEAKNSEFTKNTFLSNISHEIRTSINGILGMTDLTLMSDINLEQKENLNLVKSSALKLLDMINNILDFSKIQCGKIKLENLEFNFTDFINEIVRANTIKALEKKIELKAKIDDSIPETLMGDPIRLKQILENVLSNAVKFTKFGTVFLNVSKVEFPDKKIGLNIKVEDTGIGIEKKDLPKLFKGFSQIDNKDYTKKYNGTGLGLCICKGLIEMMGGKIEVKSKESIGTTVNFNVLLGKSKKYSSMTFIDKKEKISNDPKINKRLNILIVEDDKASQMVLSNLFKKKGHSCDIANNGQEAVKSSQNRKYDLILMDIQMPIMDGVEATALIRKSEANSEIHTPIIALTAYTLKEDKEKFLSIGMDDYISKPFKVEELLQKVYNFARDKEESNITFSNRHNTTDGSPLFLYLL